jgi:hypothetical protein
MTPLRIGLYEDARPTRLHVLVEVPHVDGSGNNTVFSFETPGVPPFGTVSEPTRSLLLLALRSALQQVEESPCATT